MIGTCVRHESADNSECMSAENLRVFCMIHVQCDCGFSLKYNYFFFSLLRPSKTFNGHFLSRVLRACAGPFHAAAKARNYTGSVRKERMVDTLPRKLDVREECSNKACEC